MSLTQFSITADALVVMVVVVVMAVIVQKNDDEGCHFPREKLALQNTNDDESLKPTNNNK